ncbi:MAG TPA: hypothetical protein VN643_12340 [Pyrinomonadaceae bacterium]|nr:hypothetical protein [Pyrinomonadaceae bacterium]
MKLKWSRLVTLALVLCSAAVTASSTLGQSTDVDEQQFGPVVRAYLGYLRNEQEVVDDRVSRREISRAYYKRNSNRIRALREIAIRIARETHNDYLPELEAVVADEMGTLFERPPAISALVVGKTYNSTFRYLGSVRSVELFHVFARLDPYEQAEDRKKSAAGGDGGGSVLASPASEPKTRPRRVRNP